MDVIIQCWRYVDTVEFASVVIHLTSFTWTFPFSASDDKWVIDPLGAMPLGPLKLDHLFRKNKTYIASLVQSPHVIPNAIFQFSNLRRVWGRSTNHEERPSLGDKEHVVVPKSQSTVKCVIVDRFPCASTKIVQLGFLVVRLIWGDCQKLILSLFVHSKFKKRLASHLASWQSMCDSDHTLTAPIESTGHLVM